MTMNEIQIARPTFAQLSALLDTWTAHRQRNAVTESAPWRRGWTDRRVTVEAALRTRFGRVTGDAPEFVALRGDRVVAFLLGREVRLPRSSGYRAYAPDHFLNIGPEDWALATPADADALTILYATLASWGLDRGAGAQLLSIQAGDDLTDFWLDLGFARHDRYAYLPRGAERAAPDKVVVRRAGAADLERAAHLSLSEARHHHAAPIFAFAPPGREAVRRRDLAERLTRPDTLVLLAEVGGQALGGLSASWIEKLPFWMPSATPTPCAFVDSAFVEPAGRGCGILRALVATLMAAIEPRGGLGLFVTYLPANRGALQAWEGLGFQPLITVHQRRLDPRTIRQHARAGREAQVL